MARLRQCPGEEARQAAMPTEVGPLPSRWTLRTIRVSVEWLADYSLSGVSRVLARHGLALRLGRVQLFSPDPAYAEKEGHLRTCLTEAAQYPDEVVVLFMDEMGYYRWPVAVLDWMADTPEAVRVAACADNNKQ